MPLGLTMEENVQVTLLTEEYSNFHYYFFYSDLLDISFYSEFSCVQDDKGLRYLRRFEVGKGIHLFNLNIEHYKANALFYKISYVAIPLGDAEFEALSTFLSRQEKRIVVTPANNPERGLEALTALDEKIDNERRK